MSEETRRALKVFGISVTNLEEVVDRMRDSDGEKLVELAKEYLHVCREINRNLLDIVSKIFEMENRGFEIIEKKLIKT